MTLDDLKIIDRVRARCHGYSAAVRSCGSLNLETLEKGLQNANKALSDLLAKYNYIPGSNEPVFIDSESVGD